MEHSVLHMNSIFFFFCKKGHREEWGLGKEKEGESEEIKRRRGKKGTVTHIVFVAIGLEKEWRKSSMTKE